MPYRLLWCDMLQKAALLQAPQSNAAFLKGDNKRGGDSGDDPWEAVPRSTGWLAG